jgi:hypothetical protein
VLVAVDLALGGLVVLDRVVDDEQIRAAAGDEPADAGGDHDPAVAVELPAVGGPRVRSHGHVEERRAVLLELAPR